MDYHFPENYDEIISRSEAETRQANERANDAFVLAMARAVQRGKENVTPGIFVDTSAPTKALRIRGDAIRSSCGSPAAMCVESGNQAADGARTLR